MVEAIESILPQPSRVIGVLAREAAIIAVVPPRKLFAESGAK
jgi:hypothetical protein